MSTHTRLPVELLFRSFDFLSSREILVAMHVCNLWRGVGRTHHTFARDVQLDGASYGAIQLFRLQLSCRPTRNLRLRILLRDAKSTTARHAIAADVLPLLVQELCRTEQLVLALPAAAHKAAVAALESSPAPQLAILDVLFMDVPNFTALGTLPTRLFAGTAPRLQALGLEGLAASHPWPVACHSLVTLIISTGDVFALDLLAELPFLADLTVMGGHSYGVPYLPTIAICRLFLRLKTLRLSFSAGIPVHIFRWKHMERIPHIGITDVHDEAIDGLLSHIQSSSDLEINVNLRTGDFYPDFYCEWQYISRSSGLTRSIDVEFDSYRGLIGGDVVPFPGLHNGAIRHSLTRLSIVAMAWLRLGARFDSPLPNCVGLVLHMTPGIPLAALGEAPLTCPAMEKVEIHSVSESPAIREDFTGIAMFLTTALRGVKKRLALVLKGLVMDGDSGVLSQIADAVICPGI
ncbi:hypothetical protein EXIGLDRAFT_840406 [Exidia glandulosa HHB12029]|uniref:F-box domain-containing protein n=1 Tax=Exidia glandulosa HHB12029 TaxID=1314781 RepID=A0A165EH22_EXIGL|nr:hypothetical protein EXIGLDRAFT_840406 [Exidia glandulosa HHB12029]